MENLQELLVEELKDLYSAEKQLKTPSFVIANGDHKAKGQSFWRCYRVDRSTRAAT